MNKESRLKNKLEIQSLQIERVFQKHRLPVSVIGGSVTNKRMMFDLPINLKLNRDRLGAIHNDLKTFLKSPGVVLGKAQDYLRVQIPIEAETGNGLLEILPKLPEIPPMTAVAGVTEDGRPLLMRFDKNEITNILISGQTGAGKTSLMRTLTLSLSILNKQSQFQFLIINPGINRAIPESTTLEPLNYISHILAGINFHLEDGIESLTFMAEELGYRIEQSITSPAIIIFIEDVDIFINEGRGSVTEPLVHLLQRGPDQGIHLILSTTTPRSKEIDNLMRTNLPTRLVGQFDEPIDVLAAAETPMDRVNYFQDRGLFYAINNNDKTLFQAAYVGDYDLLHCLELTQNRGRPTLLATPISVQTRANDSIQQGPYKFSFNGESVKFENDFIQNGRAKQENME